MGTIVARGARQHLPPVFSVSGNLQYAIRNIPGLFWGQGVFQARQGKTPAKKSFPCLDSVCFVENFFEGRRPISGKSAFVRLCRAAINAALQENRGNMFPCKHKGKLLTRNAGLRHCAGSFRNVLAVRDTWCVSYDFLTFQPRRPRFQAFPCMPINAFAVVLFL